MLKHICIFAIAASAMGSSVAVFAQKPPYSVELKIVSKLDNQVKTDTAKAYLVSATKFRVEQSSGGASRIVILNGKDLWRAEYPRKEGVHVVQTPEILKKLEQQGPNVGNNLAQFLKAGAKVIGSEKIDGVKCLIYSYKNSDGFLQKLWVDANTKLSRRKTENGVAKFAIKIGEPETTHIISSVTDFMNWQVGKPLPETLFVAPKDVSYKEAPQEIKVQPNYPVVRPQK